MPPKVTPAAAAASAAPKAPATPSASKDERPEDGASGGAAPTPEDEAGSVRSGTFSFSDGAKYKGEFTSVGGKVVRHGVGVLTNGPESYDGEWLHDEMHGHGVYVFATGARYEGAFERNAFHGAGVYTWPDGAVYDGAWQFSRMHGDGAYVDRDGVEWRGRFVNGKFDNGRVCHALR